MTPRSTSTKSRNGVGWLAAWGPSLPTALAALQVLAAERVAKQAAREAKDQDEAS